MMNSFVKSTLGCEYPSCCGIRYYTLIVNNLHIALLGDLEQDHTRIICAYVRGTASSHVVVTRQWKISHIWKHIQSPLKTSYSASL